MKSLGRLVAAVCNVRRATLRDTLRRYLFAKLFLGLGNERGFVIPSQACRVPLLGLPSKCREGDAGSELTLSTGVFPGGCQGCPGL